MRVLFLGIAFCSICFCQFQAITGTLKNPDGSSFSGTIKLELPAPASNICSTPAQAVPLKQVSVAVTNGSPASFNLYQTICLSPGYLYNVAVYNTKNQLMYRTKWQVVSGAGNITSCDITEQP